MRADEDLARLEHLLADIRQLNQRIHTLTARNRETAAALRRRAPASEQWLAEEPAVLIAWSGELRSYSDALLLDSHALIAASERVLQRARLAKSRGWTGGAPKQQASGERSPRTAAPAETPIDAGGSANPSPERPSASL